MNQLQKIAQDFSNAAAHYDDYAHIQRQVIDEMLHWIAPNSKVLDAGAGTGYALQKDWVGLDIAEGMCAKISENPVICANMQQIPCRTAQFDGVFSSLAVQWLESPETFLKEAHRCTHDDGWLVMGTLGSNSFANLRAAFNEAGFFVPLLPLETESFWCNQLEQAGWKVHSCEVKTLTTAHDSMLKLLKYIKGLGARSKQSHYENMRGKNWLTSLERHYMDKLNNKFNLSWEVIVIKANK